MLNMTFRAEAPAPLATVRAALCAIVTAALGGCASLTDVDAPDLVDPTSLETAAGASALHTGAIGVFAHAYNGGSNASVRTVIVSGLMSDELGNIGVAGWDQFDVRSTLELDSPVSEAFGWLSQARVHSLAASQMLQRYAPTPRSRIGQLFGHAGYSEILLAETFCSGITLAEVRDGKPVADGSPLTTQQVFERALTNFDSALVYAADSVRILNVARIGKARVLLNLGRHAEAASVMRTVPNTYVYVTEHSTAAQPNSLANWTTSLVATISDREGQNGLDFRSASDPRLRTVFIRRSASGFDGYGIVGLTLASPTVLASGTEARLIEAEAALKANANDVSATGWLGILNALRASAISPALAPLADPGSETGRVNLLFRERAFWLFGTAHRLGDLRRLVRQYGRSPEAVFPTGVWRTGGRAYGTDMNLVLPRSSEAANPNFKGCLDRNA